MRTVICTCALAHVSHMHISWSEIRFLFPQGNRRFMPKFRPTAGLGPRLNNPLRSYVSPPRSLWKSTSASSHFSLSQLLLGITVDQGQDAAFEISNAKFAEILRLKFIKKNI